MIGSKTKEMANLQFWKTMLKDQLKGAFKNLAADAFQLVAIKLIKEYMLKRPMRAIAKLCDKNNIPMPDFDFTKKFDLFNYI